MGVRLREILVNENGDIVGLRFLKNCFKLHFLDEYSDAFSEEDEGISSFSRIYDLTLAQASLVLLDAEMDSSEHFLELLKAKGIMENIGSFRINIGRNKYEYGSCEDFDFENASRILVTDTFCDRKLMDNGWIRIQNYTNVEYIHMHDKTRDLADLADKFSRVVYGTDFIDRFGIISCSIDISDKNVNFYIESCLSCYNIDTMESGLESFFSERFVDVYKDFDNFKVFYNFKDWTGSQTTCIQGSINDSFSVISHVPSCFYPDIIAVKNTNKRHFIYTEKGWVAEVQHESGFKYPGETKLKEGYYMAVPKFDAMMTDYEKDFDVFYKAGNSGLVHTRFDTYSFSNTKAVKRAVEDVERFKKDNQLLSDTVIFESSTCFVSRISPEAFFVHKEVVIDPSIFGVRFEELFELIRIQWASNGFLFRAIPCESNKIKLGIHFVCDNFNSERIDGET